MICSRRILAFPLFLFLCTPPVASAGVIWNEIDDAGDLLATAQRVEGDDTSLEIGSIIGTLVYVDKSKDDSVDMFAIYIDDPSTFSATTYVDGTDLLDAWLYLFNDEGYGLAASASTEDGFYFHATIGPESFEGSPGVYYIAVAKFDVRPKNNLGEIFPYLLTESLNGEVVGPDGDGGSEPLKSWIAAPVDDGPNYEIRFTGARQVQRNEVVPEPGACIVWLTLFGFLGIVLTRRRKGFRK